MIIEPRREGRCANRRARRIQREIYGVRGEDESFMTEQDLLIEL